MGRGGAGQGRGVVIRVEKGAREGCGAQRRSHILSLAHLLRNF